MKKLILPSLAMIVVLLSGCARHYVIKLNNGLQVITANKPKLKGGIYYYKDASGQIASISQSRVGEIEPASRAKKEKPPFMPEIVR